MELVTTGPGNEALMSESSEVKTRQGVGGMLLIEKMWVRNVCASMSQKQTQLGSSLYWEPGTCKWFPTEPETDHSI